MTVAFSYDGVALPDNAVILNGIDGVSQNADGTYAVGGITIDDPDGLLTFTELQEFVITEAECSRERVFTGFLSNMTIGRGTYRSGASRVYNFDLLDLNYLLHLQPLRGASAKRPIETGDDRLAWLLSSVALDGIVFDHGFVGSNTNMFDEADYTKLYADSVLDDLCVSSVTEVGRIYFVYRDDSTGDPSLFIDVPTAALYDSTLAISNDLDDVDDTTTFAPHVDSIEGSSAEGIYCSVFFVYKTGTVYRHNDTTHATYFAGAGYHRQAVFETTRVGSLTTAISHADGFLANHNGTIDTITCTVRLPKDKVNLIEAGMRLSSKFTHLPLYDTFGYLRVATRTVLLTPDTNEFYDVHLRLTNRSITPTGGGGTGDFPHPPPGAPSYVQEKGTESSTIVLDHDPTDGHLLTWFVTGRSFDPAGITPTGWTLLASCTNYDGDPSHTRAAAVFYRIASGDDATFADFAAQTGVGQHMFEWADGVTIDTTAGTFGSISDQLANGSLAIPVTPTAISTVVTGGLLGSGDSGAWTFTAGAGVTELYRDLHPGFSPTTWVGIKTGQTGATSVGGAFTSSFTQAFGGVSYAVHTDSVSSPPSSGQWVYGELVTLTGGAGTTAFHFADGSLHVRYDIIDQTPAIVSYDGATGDFAMPSQPPLGTQVFVDYQGR